MRVLTQQEMDNVAGGTFFKLCLPKIKIKLPVCKPKVWSCKPAKRDDCKPTTPELN